MSIGQSTHRSTRETFRDAIARLHAAQKPKAATPAYLRYVNRRLGGYLAAAGLAIGLTPNQLTALSALLSLAGITLIAVLAPTAWSGVVIAALLLAGYAFDSADGQLARLRGGGSPSGEWLDHVVDAAKTCLLHSAVLVGLYRFVPDLSRTVLILPLVFLTAAITLSFATMLRDQLRRTGSVPRQGLGDDSAIKSLALGPIDFGVLAGAFLCYGAPQFFVWVYGGLAVFHVLFTARLVVRTFGQLAAA